MPTTTAARVRVVLVNYRSIDDVATRLASDALSDAEVVVVDNASDPDKVVALCTEHGATPVLLPRNAGFAAGVNAGWAVTVERPPLPLLLLNPDAQLTRTALDALLAALPGHDGVAPVLLEAPRRPQVGSAGGPLSLVSVAAYFLFLSAVLPSLQGLFLTRAQARRGGQVSWLCMASLLLVPDALVRFGPLPEDELVYAEDLAWGTAASLQGARFRLLPEVQVAHPHGSSGGGAAWSGALERLLRRRLPAGSGRLAVLCMRVGLAVRRGATIARVRSR